MLILVSISIMLLGLWIIWRVVSINPPDLPTQARARGIVLPKDFVGPTFTAHRLEQDALKARTYNPKARHPHFWGDDEP